MKRLATIATVLVAGCASTGSIMNAAPDRVYRSERAATEVSNCLRVELTDAGRTPIILEESGQTVFLYKNMYGATDLAFTVRAEGAGSRIELRRANFPFTFSGAESCFRPFAIQ